MDHRFPPLSPQPPQRAMARSQTRPLPLPLLPLGEWLVFSLFIVMLVLA